MNRNHYRIRPRPRRALLHELNVYAINDLVSDLEAIVLDKTDDPRILQWFKSKYVKWIKDNADDNDKMGMFRQHEPRDGDPEWSKNSFDFTGFNNTETNKINHIIDYFFGLQPLALDRIDRQPYSLIKSAVEAWDIEMKTISRRSARGQVDGTLIKWTKKGNLSIRSGVDYKILEYAGNLIWIRHLTDASLSCEGDEMGHCVGGGGFTNEPIVSLWDSGGNSKATLQISRDLTQVKQIKGYSNSKPKPRVIPVIQKYITEKGMEVVGDGEALGMIRYENKYYFKNTPEWETIYKEKLQPKQKVAIANILKQIRKR